jgi:hypothetical protein
MSSMKLYWNGLGHNRKSIILPDSGKLWTYEDHVDYIEKRDTVEDTRRLFSFGGTQTAQKNGKIKMRGTDMQTGHCLATICGQLYSKAI